MLLHLKPQTKLSTHEHSDWYLTSIGSWLNSDGESNKVRIIDYYYSISMRSLVGRCDGGYIVLAASVPVYQSCTSRLIAYNLLELLRVTQFEMT